jgi:anti-sigma B factor antagonist
VNIEVNKQGGTATLALSGTLTLGRGDAVLRSTFNDQLELGERFIVLDMTRVDYLDSAGVGELVACSKRAAARCCIVKVAASPAGKARQILSATGIERVFEVYDDEPSARASFEF